MITLNRLLTLGIIPGLALLGCAEDDVDKTEPETGTIHLTASYDGEVPEGSTLTAAVINCPFVMPPLMNPPPAFPVTAFPAEGDFTEVPAGEHCLYVFMDTDPTDGFTPVFEIDPINVLAAGTQSLPITVVAGEVTDVHVDLTLAEPGVTNEEVTVNLTVECETCDTDTTLKFYGTRGEAIVMPNYYHEFETPSFPFTTTLTVSSGITGGEVQWSTGTTTFEAYQDTVEGGRMVEEGEPVSAPLTVELTSGANDVLLRLE